MLGVFDNAPSKALMLKKAPLQSPFGDCKAVFFF
jgi:hypothetical protein